MHRPEDGEAKKETKRFVLSYLDPASRMGPKSNMPAAP